MKWTRAKIVCIWGFSKITRCSLVLVYCLQSAAHLFTSTQYSDGTWYWMLALLGTGWGYYLLVNIFLHFTASWHWHLLIPFHLSFWGFREISGCRRECCVGTRPPPSDFKMCHLWVFQREGRGFCANYWAGCVQGLNSTVALECSWVWLGKVLEQRCRWDVIRLMFYWI